MESILPNALPGALPSENVLNVVWSLIVKVMRRDVLSREEELLLERVRTGSQTYGAPILEATSLENLKDRIAEVAESSDFNGYWQGMMTTAMGVGDRLWKSSDFVRRSVEDAREVLQTVLSGGAMPRAELGLRYLEASAQMFPLIIKWLRDICPEVFTGSPIDIVYDQDCPQEIAEALYENLCGTVVTFALNAAALRQQKLAPWLSIGLAERWERGLKENLRLISLDAALAAELPESVLPREERFDLDAMMTRRARVASAFDALNEAAENAGAPIYPTGL